MTTRPLHRCSITNLISHLRSGESFHTHIDCKTRRSRDKMMISSRALRTVVTNTRHRTMATTISSWATIDPLALGTTGDVYAVPNCVDGVWAHNTKATIAIPHPLDKNAPAIFTIPDTKSDELQPFFDSMRKVPKTGLHNPLKNNHRYLEYGEISRKVRDVMLPNNHLVLHVTTNTTFTLFAWLTCPMSTGR